MTARQPIEGRLGLALATLSIAILAPTPSRSADLDRVYLRDKTVIEGKVIQVTKTEIEIDPIGDKPFFTIPRDKVAVLIYADNTVITFNNTLESAQHDVASVQAFHCEVEIVDLDSDFTDTYRIDESVSAMDSITGEALEVSLKGSFRVRQFQADRITYYETKGIEVSSLNVRINVKSKEGSFHDVLVFDGDYRAHFGEEVSDGFEEIQLGPYEAKFIFVVSNVRIGKPDPDGDGRWCNARLGMDVELIRGGDSW